MHLKPYEFEQHDGWPPDKSAGFFFGFDANGNPSILRWIPELNPAGGWVGTWLTNRYDFGIHKPEAFTRGPDTEDNVVKWADVPTTFAQLEADSSITLAKLPLDDE